MLAAQAESSYVLERFASNASFPGQRTWCFRTTNYLPITFISRSSISNFAYIRNHVSRIRSLPQMEHSGVGEAVEGCIFSSNENMSQGLVSHSGNSPVPPGLPS